MLTVYKASAGSGKTFRLVTEYILLLLKNPNNYKHILAVTFTNKATSEMKSRILRQLHLLASGQSSPMLENLMKEGSYSETFIRKQARQVLKNMLHDYNRFSISTIDAFTQRIIKAFNREMGISPQFSLELNDDLILAEAVDRLLARTDKDTQLRRWLVDFSREKITDNKSQQIEDDIKSLGKELFKEKFQLFFPAGEETPYTREKLKAFRSLLNKTISTYESTLRKKAAEGLRMIEEAGLEPDDFAGKSRGIGGFFEKMAAGEQPNVSPTVEKCEEDTEKWAAAKSPKKEEIRALAQQKLQPLLHDILDFIHQNKTGYTTAFEVRRQIRMLGILTDLKEEIKTLLHEKGMLQLSGSNLLLSKIIGDSDSPFIYEKIGNHFRHFMLDEFQDTSSLQWNNFKPLVTNSLASGYSNLLVGDVKQSIYRWRNSDWNILARQINSDFPHSPPQEITLDTNWRSRKNIIDFNNAVFGALLQTFREFLLPGTNEEFQKKFDTIYDSYKQEMAREIPGEQGRVEVRFFEEENFSKTSARMLVEEVKQLQDQGLEASQIAILVRKNNEGTPIIETFLEASRKPENKDYNLSVLSNESLFLRSSPGVNFVIAVLRWLVDPGNQINQVALLHLWLSWLKPRLNHPENPPGTNPAGSWQLTGDFEYHFEKELGPRTAQLREKVLLAAADETIMHICNDFGLFQIASEWPFLQTLIDQTASIKASISNDLSNLLYWWEEQGTKIAVNVNDEVNAVRLLTVHKAKGLEFEAVLIPGLDWSTSWQGNQAPILWCEPSAAPFNQFPLLPVKAGRNLEKTIFRDHYLEEKGNAIVDTLNLVYVAFTRAQSALMIHAPLPRPKKNSKNNSDPGKSLNTLLKYALGPETSPGFHPYWNEEKTTFSLGRIPAFSAENTSGESEWISRYRFLDFSNRIRLRINSEDFLITGEAGQSTRNKGKIIHEILSDITTRNDVKAACQKAVSEGKIDAGEAVSIGQMLSQSLERPLVKNWFNGSYRVINERELLTPDNLLRPDRIMISANKAIVVDYKWGEKVPGKYHQQVRQYAQILREAGFENVTGYLWYIHLNEVEEVSIENP